MPNSRRAQVLLEPDEYSRLEDLARVRGISVSSLIRDAVKDRYFPDAPDRQAIVDELLLIRAPIVEDWRELNALIEDSKLADIH